MPDNFGSTLRVLRLASDVSETSLARHLDITVEGLADLEEGRTEPSRELVELVARYFDVTVKDLGAL